MRIPAMVLVGWMRNLSVMLRGSQIEPKVKIPNEPILMGMQLKQNSLDRQNEPGLKAPEVGWTPSSARDPLVALFAWPTPPKHAQICTKRTQTALPKRTHSGRQHKQNTAA
jgi:hypothetical protein